jgi:kumamolisin
MNRYTRLLCIAVTSWLLPGARFATAQTWPPGRVSVPQSSVEKPEDIGERAHTNVEIVVPFEALPVPAPGEAQALAIRENPSEFQPLTAPVAGYFFETPASLGCVYHLVSPLVAGCNPNVVIAVPSGGSKALAIVDAYDDPTALSDLQHFSTQFGLTAVSSTNSTPSNPKPPNNAPLALKGVNSADSTPLALTSESSGNFQVVYASGTRPPTDPTGGWELEESLDIEWAHAMAPGAKIFLVEAKSNSFSDLLTAEDVAGTLVAAAGGGEVSNSWGGSEFSGETAFDSYFQKASVVYFAASGDSPGVIYPSTSPFVVSAGGTSTTRVLSNGAFNEEVAWQDGGGGVSAFEPRPSYQNVVSQIVGSNRGTPDLSFDSAAETPVWVYATSTGPLGQGWFIVYGTSVATCSLAGIVNSAGNFYASTAAELAIVYGNRAAASDFNDITEGNCGPYGSLFATVGYDLCTGVGSDHGKAGK